MKHLKVFAALLAISLVAGASYGAYVWDFEDGTTQGWSGQSGTVVSVVPDPTGASNYVLKIQPNLNTFVWAIRKDYSWPDADDFALFLKDNPIIQLDVIFVAADWTGYPESGAWARLDQIALNSGTTGWKQTNDSMITDPANPNYPGSWDPYYWGQNFPIHKRTLTYNVSSLVTAINGTETWFQVWLATNSGGGFATGAYYIDNIIIPEPASLALMALAGLLLRRRS